jgi:hypothetical protein
MARGDEELIQLATRIPARLHRAIKLHCVEQGTSVMEFVAEALQERLNKTRGRGGGGRRAAGRRRVRRRR